MKVPFNGLRSTGFDLSISSEPHAGTDAVTPPVADDAEIGGRQKGKGQRQGRLLDIGFEIILVEQIVDECGNLKGASPVCDRTVDEEIFVQDGRAGLADRSGNTVAFSSDPARKGETAVPNRDD